MSKRLGGDCFLYRNTGTYASPVWNEITNAENVSRPDSRAVGEAKTRGSDFVLSKVGKRMLGLGFTLVYDPSDDDYPALRTAYDAKTAVEIAAMDGPIATSGSQGLRASFQISEFPIEEPLEEFVNLAVAMVPTISANAPAWMTVGS